jgi:carbon storage regulator
VLLVLARKVEQGFKLGDNITVRVLSADKGSVSIGIDAPKEIVILRKELKETVDFNKTAATSAKQDAAAIAALLNKKSQKG